MIHFPTMLKRAMVALMLGSLFALAGCQTGGTKDTVSTAAMEGQFDATLQAYKDGQFMLGGAVLSALDVGSHFAYLKDQGKLPKTVLLLPSDSSKIRKRHLEYMARMQMDYGFTVFYDDKGTLTKINPVETKARALEDHRAPSVLPDEQKGKSASDGGFDPSQQQQQQRQY
ncbi:MAG: hypothetical protein ABI343_01800 [Burkholderiaceae bacterium]